MFSLSQSVGSSADCHVFSKMMDSGLETTCANSLKTCRYIASGLMDLCTLGLLILSQTWSSPTEGGSSFSKTPPLPFGAQAMWLELLPVKVEAKKPLNTSAFSISQVTAGESPQFPSSSFNQWCSYSDWRCYWRCYHSYHQVQYKRNSRYIHPKRLYFNKLKLLKSSANICLLYPALFCCH